jgi:hypothetical protein
MCNAALKPLYDQSVDSKRTHETLDHFDEKPLKARRFAQSQVKIDMR